ncbi:hypothetical protein [Pseudoneobacillus rhizosphaerae]|uniref:Uncharacterized protein n=1 Tax=Pseudoneobacillus rhizosphaerae TaxID=2880968 RepID=A0A9C7LA38_9BACI|nr:hypothetical protein [Pseudoneobacillus rhizosphaerae]CAG9608027.1 hypothetical protein NEOCIP111885_01719 [Pseudoneobacillus rhizosphaerae]
MNFEDATKKQLLQIVLNENCPLDYKYAAARELQLKTWSSLFLQKLVKYWGMGLSEVEIAERFGVEVWEVKKQLQKYQLFGKRVIKGGMRR